MYVKFLYLFFFVQYMLMFFFFFYLAVILGRCYVSCLLYSVWSGIMQGLYGASWLGARDLDPVWSRLSRTFTSKVGILIHHKFTFGLSERSMDSGLTDKNLKFVFLARSESTWYKLFVSVSYVRLDTCIFVSVPNKLYTVIPIIWHALCELHWPSAWHVMYVSPLFS